MLNQIMVNLVIQISLNLDSVFFTICGISFADSLILLSSLVISDSYSILCSFILTRFFSFSSRSLLLKRRLCSNEFLFFNKSFFSLKNSSNLTIVSSICSTDLSVSLTEMLPATTDLITACKTSITAFLVSLVMTSYGFSIIFSITTFNGFS